MLVQFSVSNFRSFRDRRILSLVASPDDTHPDNTIQVSQPSKMRLLKSAAIYGPNASGKSNLIKALAFLKRFVIDSASKFQGGDAIPTSPFKLDAEWASKPSEFEVVFIHQQQRYVYGFSADSERVHREWLTVARTAKPSLLFERHTRDQGGSEIICGHSWKGGSEQLREYTRDNALFLSVAAQYNNPTVTPVFEWFRDWLRGISDQPDLEKAYTIQQIERDAVAQQVILRGMRLADLGIDDLKLERVPLVQSSLWADLDEDARRKILSRAPPDADLQLNRVKMGHRMGDGGGDLVWFDLDSDESAGTERFFCLFGPWMYMLKHGCTLFIDELGTRLHPLLTRLLVAMAHGPGVESQDHQLVFATHDSTLLDPGLFRRDQIWFAEKDASGATDLYSLWDYRVRKDENFESGYLKGRYGAIPFIGDLPFA